MSCLYPWKLEVKHGGEGAGYKAGMVRWEGKRKKTSGFGSQSQASLCSGTGGRASVSTRQLVSGSKGPKDTMLVVNCGWQKYGQILLSSLHFSNSLKAHKVTNSHKERYSLYYVSISKVEFLWFYAWPFVVERRKRVTVTGMVTACVGSTAFSMVLLSYSRLCLGASVTRRCLSFHFHPLTHVSPLEMLPLQQTPSFYLLWQHP